MTDKWEVVHNTKKSKAINDLQKNNASKKDKQKKTDKMTKITTDLRKSGFITVSDDDEDLVGQRGGNKFSGTAPNKKDKPASNNMKGPLKNGDANKASGGVTKSLGGSGDGNREPLTLKEALETLSVDEIKTQFSCSQVSFPNQPQIWLIGIADYLNRQLSPSSCLPASAPTIAKIISGEFNMIDSLNKAAKKQLRTILESQKSELDTFVSNLVDLIIRDTSRNNTALMGSRLMLLLILHNFNSKYLVASFQTLHQYLHQYRMNTPQALRVVWCIEQAMASSVDTVTSFFVAYRAFLEVLLPNVTTNNKQLSGAIVDFSEKLMKIFVQLRNKMSAEHIGKQQQRYVKLDDVCKMLDILHGISSSNVIALGNKQPHDQAADQCVTLNSSIKNRLSKVYSDVVKVLVLDKKVHNSDIFWSQLFDQLMTRLSRKSVAAANHEILTLLTKCLLEQPELCFTAWCSLTSADLRAEQTNLMLGHFIKDSKMFQAMLKKNYKKVKSTLIHLKNEHKNAAGRGNTESANVVKNAEILLEFLGSSKNRIYHCSSIFFTFFKFLKFLVKCLFVVLLIITFYDLLSHKWLYTETRAYKYYTQTILPLCMPYWTSFVSTIYSSAILKQVLDQIQLTYITYVHPSLLVFVDCAWKFLQRVTMWSIDLAVQIGHNLQPYYEDFKKTYWPRVVVYLQPLWDSICQWTAYFLNVIIHWINNIDWSAVVDFFLMIYQSVCNWSIVAYNYAVTQYTAFTS